MNKLSNLLVSSLILGGLTVIFLDNNVAYATEIQDNTDLETIITDESVAGIEDESSIEDNTDTENDNEVEAGDEVLTDVYEVSEEEQEAGIQESIEEIMDTKLDSPADGQISMFTVPEYKKTEFVKVETKYATGTKYIGNQPAGGVFFKNGGLISWNPNGGPSGSLSVSFSAGVVSVGVSYGSKSNSSTGYSARIPAGAYYKVKVKKTMKVVKTAVYGYPMNGGSKKFLYYIYPSTLHSYGFIPVKVN